MADADKRHTRINLQPIDSHVEQSFKREATIPNPRPPSSLSNSTEARRRGTFFPYTKSRQRLSLARPPYFPIVPLDHVELACPWSSYRKTYKLRFGVDFRVRGAQKIDGPCTEVLIRHFPNDIGKDKLQMLYELRHDNILEYRGAFRYEKAVHAVFEHVEVSLHEIAMIRITLLELAAILGQVVQGLVFLSKMGLEHGSLTCSNILVSREGVVKIAAQEGCHPRALEETRSRDLQALTRIAKSLIGADIDSEGEVSRPNPQLWVPKAINFVDATSAMSIHEILDDPLLKLPWSPGLLKSVVSKAIRKVRINLDDAPSPV